MRQVHVQDPWAGVVYSNDREMVGELMSRIQMLETRVRELEGLVRGVLEAEIEVAEQQVLPEPEPATVGS
jgi:hypothetical protein